MTEGLTEEHLRSSCSIQGMEYTGIGALLHVVEHLSYHTGQITFAVKLLKETDLGYNAGLDLNRQND